MRRKNGKELIARYFNGHVIAYTMRAGRVLWQSIRSCFGAGYWIGEKPWIGEEGWKGGK